MEAKGWILFNVLINRFHPQDAVDFRSTLPKQFVQELDKHKTASSDVLGAFSIADEQLKRIHHSWLVVILEEAPDSMRQLYLASLPKELKSAVGRLMRVPAPKFKLPSVSRHILLKQLAKRVTPSDVLPTAFLPASPLNELANLSRDELVRTCDYLGLRDLAEAVRPVVDKRLLQAVHRCLTPPELQLLRVYLHQREKLIVSKIELHQWDGQSDSLRVLFHRRGLVRLAKALSGQPRDLLWHISHKLDRRRAVVLEGFWLPTVITGITPLLMQQVIGIMDFVKRQASEQ